MQARPGPVLPLVDFTASPHCRYGAGRRADYLPACKGSVDLWLPGHALARNWRQPVVSVSFPRLPGKHLTP